MNKIKWPLMSDPLNYKMRFELAYFILKASRFSYGPRVEKFEEEWNSWLGSEHSLFVSSGSTANLLLLDAVKEYYNITDRSKVLVSAVTWATNINPVIQCNLDPIFLDVSLENFGLDPLDFKKRYTFDPEEIKIIFVTHLIGYPANTDKIKEIFPNAILIEDCCESHGCKVNDKKVGADSIGCTFSFFIGHHMTTIEGGMVSTSNSDLYHLMKTKRSHGLLRDYAHNKTEGLKKAFPDIDPSFFFVTTGYNFRNHEIPAYLGSLQLKKLDQSIEIRNRNFHLFREMLVGYEDFFVIPEKNDGMSSFCLPFFLKDKAHKSKLEHELKIAGIEFRPIIGGNLLKHPFLQQYHQNKASSFTNAEFIHNHGLYIGNNQFISHKDISYLEKILKNIF